MNGYLVRQRGIHCGKPRVLERTPAAPAPNSEARLAIFDGIAEGVTKC